MNDINNDLVWFDDNEKHIEELKKHPEYKAILIAEEPEAGVCAYSVLDPSGKAVKPPQ